VVWPTNLLPDGFDKLQEACIGKSLACIKTITTIIFALLSFSLFISQLLSSLVVLSLALSRSRRRTKRMRRIERKEDSTIWYGQVEEKKRI
jgi:hypothetical protein